MSAYRCFNFGCQGAATGDLLFCSQSCYPGGSSFRGIRCNSQSCSNPAHVGFAYCSQACSQGNIQVPDQIVQRAVMYAAQLSQSSTSGSQALPGSQPAQPQFRTTPLQVNGSTSSQTAINQSGRCRNCRCAVQQAAFICSSCISKIGGGGRCDCGAPVYVDTRCRVFGFCSSSCRDRSLKTLFNSYPKGFISNPSSDYQIPINNITSSGSAHGSSIKGNQSQSTTMRPTSSIRAPSSAIKQDTAPVPVPSISSSISSISSSSSSSSLCRIEEGCICTLSSSIINTKKFILDQNTMLITKDEHCAWAEIDLGRLCFVSFVKMKFRGDRPNFRVVGSVYSLQDKRAYSPLPSSPVLIGDPKQSKSIDSLVFEMMATPSSSSSFPVQFITLQLNGNGAINLEAIAVFGQPSSSTQSSSSSSSSAPKPSSSIAPPKTMAFDSSSKSSFSPSASDPKTTITPSLSHLGQSSVAVVGSGAFNMPPTKKGGWYSFWFVVISANQQQYSDGLYLTDFAANVTNVAKASQLFDAFLRALNLAATSTSRISLIDFHKICIAMDQTNNDYFRANIIANYYSTDAINFTSNDMQKLLSDAQFEGIVSDEIKKLKVRIPLPSSIATVANYIASDLIHCAENLLRKP